MWCQYGSSRNRYEWKKRVGKTQWLSMVQIFCYSFWDWDMFTLSHSPPFICYGCLFLSIRRFSLYHFVTFNCKTQPLSQILHPARLHEIRDYNDRGVTSLMRKAWAFFCRKDFCSGFFVMESCTMVNILAIYSPLEQLFHISIIPPVTNCFMLLK